VTERLYYADSYVTDFTAAVLECLLWQGEPAVVLDRTAFYPSSGGQPSDRGDLGGIEVVDVVVRETDKAVVHVLRAPLDTRRVDGSIDWMRRFDHMQQHTGQHIISAAFEKLLGANTVGFHIGAESSTADIAWPHMTADDVAQVEKLSNQIIWEDHRVTVRFISQEELASLSLRRQPAVEENIRLIDIQGFDLNPCGGTHVSRSGEVGLIKVTHLEHRGDVTRVEFLCGKRAFADYRSKNDVIDRLAHTLSVGYWELDSAVSRLQAERKQARRDLRRARERLVDLETRELVRSAVNKAGFSVVARVWSGRDSGEIRALAQVVTRTTGVVALLASVTEGRAYLCFSRADDVGVDAAELLRSACHRLGGKGGGRPHLAQGSAPCGDVKRVESVVADVVLALD